MSIHLFSCLFFFHPPFSTFGVRSLRRFLLQRHCRINGLLVKAFLFVFLASPFFDFRRSFRPSVSLAQALPHQRAAYESLLIRFSCRMLLLFLSLCVSSFAAQGGGSNNQVTVLQTYPDEGCIADPTTMVFTIQVTNTHPGGGSSQGASVQYVFSTSPSVASSTTCSDIPTLNAGQSVTVSWSPAFLVV